MTKKPDVHAPPTRAELRKAVSDSGFPVELAVVDAAERAGFVSMPNWTWWDEQARTLRELDVAASYEVAGRVSLQVHALVECKRAGDGVVVFETPSHAFDAIQSPHLELGDAHTWGQPGSIKFRPGGDAGSPLVQALGWGSTRWRPMSTISTVFGTVRSRNTSPPSFEVSHGPDANESVDALTRGLIAFQEEIGLVADGAQHPYVNLAALVLVVEGKLFRYGLASDGKRRLREIREATWFRRSVVRGKRMMFRVDIIRRTHASAYFTRLCEDAAEVSRWLGANEALVRESVAMFGNTRTDQWPTGS